MTTRNTRLECEYFRPIHGQEGNGYAALGIYDPPSFWSNDQWAVFVAGCGSGHASSYDKAKDLLYQRALEYCDRQIRYAQAIIDHYREQRAILERDGLVPSATASGEPES